VAEVAALAGQESAEERERAEGPGPEEESGPEEGPGPGPAQAPEQAAPEEEQAQEPAQGRAQERGRTRSEPPLTATTRCRTPTAGYPLSRSLVLPSTRAGPDQLQG
jgi:hypothetical protein